MSVSIDISSSISKFSGEFKSKKIEKEYTEYEISKILKYIKLSLLFIGITFFLFIIPDYFVIKNIHNLKIIFLDRVIFLIISIFLYYGVKFSKSHKNLFIWTTMYEIIGSIVVINILYFYKAENPFLQTFSVIIIIMAVFLIPNRWIFSILISTVISAADIIIFLSKLGISEYSAIVVDLILIVILSGFSSLRANYYKRVQYLNNKELKQLSLTDSLTGLYNRLKFNEELSKWINLKKRYNNNFSLIMFDVDDFKIINDTYGHNIGDIVLIQLSNLAKEQIREMDILARWGGEEFIILLPNTNQVHAMELANRLRLSINNYNFESIKTVTCSFGVKEYNSEDTIDVLLSKVDNLLYQAKKCGKNIAIGSNI